MKITDFRILQRLSPKHGNKKVHRNLDFQSFRIFQKQHVLISGMNLLFCWISLHLLRFEGSWRTRVSLYSRISDERFSLRVIGFVQVLTCIEIAYVHIQKVTELQWRFYCRASCLYFLFLQPAFCFFKPLLLPIECARFRILQSSLLGNCSFQKTNQYSLSTKFILNFPSTCFFYIVCVYSVILAVELALRNLYFTCNTLHFPVHWRLWYI